MGRAALQEDNHDHYKFFYIIANEMIDMEKVPDGKQAEEARKRIIAKISADEQKFSRVSVSENNLIIF